MSRHRSTAAVVIGPRVKDHRTFFVYVFSMDISAFRSTGISIKNRFHQKQLISKGIDQVDLACVEVYVACTKWRLRLWKWILLLLHRRKPKNGSNDVNPRVTRDVKTRHSCSLLASESASPGPPKNKACQITGQGAPLGELFLGSNIAGTNPGRCRVGRCFCCYYMVDSPCHVEGEYCEYC